ncbi:helix-turn-helix domain-containing protein [Cellulosimicrobium sp. XJ-DQ-B-000]|uniref:TetR/AcrR family transcriptional regulator n=1 Tax=Cellulosimicrobium sp. XJ-DQ-B-000 TaxID=3072182 RepID=UPI00280A19CA|nr:helix-turn-helix domain-containing protein [Cellulosimicrobium sp. XJ-DQ-B-000]MDQ8041603.1 helix-turn-helix domain-containing protein [Cellulosimicrobium sp. XJ-DQ-B-000]
MPPPPAARAKVLRAFASLLVEQGERAATLEAVAERAGVSKGGLLYHFGSKDALADGLTEHLRELTAADVEAMRAAPAGAVDYLIRTSTLVDTEFELVYLAVSRLAQGSYPRARAALDGAHDAWTRAVLDEVGDPVVAHAIVLLSDGLYAHAALSSDVLGRVTGGDEGDDGDGTADEDLAFRGPRPGDDVDDLLGLIGELVALRRPDGAAQRQRS